MNLSLPSRQFKQSLAALVAAAIGITTTSAATFTWRGTNSTVWTDSGNWLAKSVAPTNGTFNHRLEVNNAAFTPMIYDAGQGTTMSNPSLPNYPQWGTAVPGMGRTLYAGVNVTF